MVKLVFKTHNMDVGAKFRLIAILSHRGFKLNSEAKGTTMKSTQNIVIDLQTKVFTPYSLKHIVFTKPSYSYFIEVED